MSILQTTNNSSIAHSQQDLICLPLDLYGLLFVYAQKQDQHDLQHFKHVPHPPDTQVLSPWVTTKNIVCIRVANTLFSHLILEIVQLAIAIAKVVLNMVLSTQFGFMQWRTLIIHHQLHFCLYLHRFI